VTRPAIQDVYRARRGLGTQVRRTPLVASRWLGEHTGADVRLKLESLQRTGSFKFRGALWAALRMSQAVERGPGARGQGMRPPRLVTASAGNHGVALAEAAAIIGADVTIFTPAGAPRTKLDAIRRRAADLRPVARHYDEAERLAMAFARDEGAAYVSPYSHADVIAGAGTIGVEIVEDEPDIDLVIVPVGGGGLIGGIATAVKALSTATRVVGVEAGRNPAFTTSLAAGRIVEIPVQPTVADGLGGNIEAGSLTFDLVRDLVDEVVTVTEDELRAGMRELLRHEHLVAEGAGAPAVAALLAGKVHARGLRVAAVVSGSNVDFATLAGVLTSRRDTMPDSETTA
jgi:threonine dehydratase